MLKLNRDTSAAQRIALIALACAIFVLVAATTASASLDTYFLGDGHEGSVSVTTDSPLNYSAPLAASVSAGASALTTGPGQIGASGTAATTGSAAQAGFEPGRLVLIIQSSGFTGTATSGDQTAIDLSASSTGRWELARIATVSGSIASSLSITFNQPIAGSYSAPGAQIVGVPEFTDVQIASGAGWHANPWDGASGGVTAFLATGATSLIDATSSINADGAGFRGGVLHNADGVDCVQLDGAIGGGKGESFATGLYPGDTDNYVARGNFASGGGGGDCANAGGGGGGNAGQGGTGGFSYDGSRDVGGLGGAKLIFSAFDHALFGGGGGAGDENNDNGGGGGAGGGLVFVRGGSLTGDGQISASGDRGANSVNIDAGDGAGGGGAGGTVYARFTGAADCDSAAASGGGGGDEQSTAGVHGPGGGGAGGRVLLQAASGSCPSFTPAGVAGTTPNGTDGMRGAGPNTSDDPSATGSSESFPGGGGLSQPTAAISGPADGRRVGTTKPSISGTSSMASGTVLISIDGGTEHVVATTPSGVWSYTPLTALSEGPHAYVARASYYGIVGPSTSARSLIVDTTPPIIAVTRDSPPAGVSPTFNFNSSEALTTYECQIDGGATASCGSPFPAPALDPGAHVLSVRGTDAAGNSGTTVTAFVVAAVPRGGSTGSTGPSGGGPEAPACTGLSGAPALSAKISLLNARISHQRLRLRLSTDQAGIVVIRGAIGRRQNGRFTGLARAGTRTYTVKLKRASSRARQFSVSVSIVARSGARSTISTMIRATKSGGVLASPDALPLVGKADCAAPPGAKKPQLKVSPPKRLGARATAAKFALRARDWTLALVSLDQPQNAGRAYVVLLRPGRKLTTIAHLDRGGRLVKGRSTITIRAISPDGARRTITRGVSVR